MDSPIQSKYIQIYPQPSYMCHPTLLLFPRHFTLRAFMLLTYSSASLPLTSYAMSLMTAPSEDMLPHSYYTYAHVSPTPFAFLAFMIYHSRRYPLPLAPSPLFRRPYPSFVALRLRPPTLSFPMIVSREICGVHRCCCCVVVFLYLFQYRVALTAAAPRFFPVSGKGYGIRGKE